MRKRTSNRINSQASLETVASAVAEIQETVDSANHPQPEPVKRRPQIGDLAYSDVCDQSGVIVGEACGHYILAYTDKSGEITLCSGSGEQHFSAGQPPIDSSALLPMNLPDHARMLLRAARYLQEQIEIFENIATEMKRVEICAIPSKSLVDVISGLVDLSVEHDAIPSGQLETEYRQQRDRDTTAISGLAAFIESWRKWGAADAIRTV